MDPTPIASITPTAIADAEERARITTALDGASLDELRVVRWIAERMASGRARYGALELATDPRDWIEEAGEEAIDGLAYLAMAALRGGAGNRERAAALAKAGE